MEDDGKLVYNAQSPDEAALVAAAKNFGYVFKSRTPFSITLHKLSSGEEVCRLESSLEGSCTSSDLYTSDLLSAS